MRRFGESAVSYIIRRLRRLHPWMSIPPFSGKPAHIPSFPSLLKRYRLIPYLYWSNIGRRLLFGTSIHIGRDTKPFFINFIESIGRIIATGTGDFRYVHLSGAQQSSCLFHSDMFQALGNGHFSSSFHNTVKIGFRDAKIFGYAIDA